MKPIRTRTRQRLGIACLVVWAVAVAAMLARMPYSIVVPLAVGSLMLGLRATL